MGLTLELHRKVFPSYELKSTAIAVAFYPHWAYMGDHVPSVPKKISCGNQEMAARR
jgi:hypothetical protein